MVVGNGLMAKAFSNYKDNDVIIFASGVSNSTETSIKEFQKEFDLLQKIIKENRHYKFVYFSTCSINDEAVKNKPYIQHKLLIEKYIKNNCSKYLIFRVSNVVGPEGNVNTIMNYLVNAVRNNNEVDIWKYAERNLIDKDDVKTVVDAILVSDINNKTINIANRKSVLVIEILNQIEKYLNKKAKINLISKGNKLQIDVSDISKTLSIIESTKGLGLNYINNLLQKYY